MKTATTKIFLLLIFIWITLAFFNIFYNAFKSVSEVKEWAFLSENKKREKIFGDLYNFLNFINTNTDNESLILIVSKDGMTYYLGRYYLYPKIIYHTDDKNKVNSLIKTKNYEYIALYNDSINLDNFVLVASYSATKSSNSSFLYKRK